MMRVYTEIILDIETGKICHFSAYDYDGPMAECKRGAAKSETLGMANADQARAQNLSKLQQAMISPETSFLQSMINNPTGFTPADLSAMRTSAMQNNATQYGTALSQLKSALASRGLMGGATPTAGLGGRDYASFLAREAGNQANTLANINIQNALQAQQNRWNAAGMLGNYAQIFNPNGFVAGSTGQMGNLGQLYTAPTTLSNMLTRMTPSTGVSATTTF